MLEIPRDPSRRVLRQFAATWSVFFGAGALYLYFARGPVPLAVAASLAAVLGFGGVAYPRAARPLFLAAGYVASPVGNAVSLALLAVAYYAVITPVAWLSRRSGRDPLHLRGGRDADSGWIRREGSAPAARYLRQY